MSIFDSLKRTAESTLKKEAAKAVNNAAQSVLFLEIPTRRPVD